MTVHEQIGHNVQNCEKYHYTKNEPTIAPRVLKIRGFKAVEEVPACYARFPRGLSHTIHRVSITETIALSLKSSLYRQEVGGATYWFFLTRQTNEIS